MSIGFLVGAKDYLENIFIVSTIDTTRLLLHAIKVSPIERETGAFTLNIIFSVFFLFLFLFFFFCRLLSFVRCWAPFLIFIVRLFVVQVFVFVLFFVLNGVPSIFPCPIFFSFKLEKVPWIEAPQVLPKKILRTGHSKSRWRVRNVGQVWRHFLSLTQHLKLLHCCISGWSLCCCWLFLSIFPFVC